MREAAIATGIVFSGEAPCFSRPLSQAYNLVGPH